MKKKICCRFTNEISIRENKTYTWMILSNSNYFWKFIPLTVYYFNIKKIYNIIHLLLWFHLICPAASEKSFLQCFCFLFPPSFSTKKTNKHSESWGGVRPFVFFCLFRRPIPETSWLFLTSCDRCPYETKF